MRSAEPGLNLSPLAVLCILKRPRPKTANTHAYVVDGGICFVAAHTVQGDKEFAQGLPLSPLCDRREKNLPKSQCDFIDFIVRPCVTIFSSYCQVRVAAFCALELFLGAACVCKWCPRRRSC